MFTIVVVLFIIVGYTALFAPQTWAQASLLVGAILVVILSWRSLPGGIFLGSIYIGGMVCILSGRFALQSSRVELGRRRALGRHLLVSLLAFPVSFVPLFLAVNIASLVGSYMFFGDAGMGLIVSPLIVAAIYVLAALGVVVALMRRTSPRKRDVPVRDALSSGCDE